MELQQQLLGTAAPPLVGTVDSLWRAAILPGFDISVKCHEIARDHATGDREQTSAA